MPDNVIQPGFQPYMKLVKSNMELLGKYSASSEAVSQAMSPAQGPLAPETGAPSSLAQSNALTELVRGMIKNHTEFAAEVGQSGMALLAQGQAALIEQTERATHMVSDAAGGRARRSR